MIPETAVATDKSEVADMYNPTMRFSSENRLFSYAFAALVTLSSLPVLAWHYWQSLDGVAVLALTGLALADLVLWQSTHWSFDPEPAQTPRGG
jgi:hypothetical protein